MIHGELLKLGFDVAERSVARYLRRAPRRGDPATRWAAFLANHREAIVACDFFTVPTLTFQLLSCFFVIEHHRRTILHFNVTREPTAAWVVQQLRDVFPGDRPHRFILIDHDSTFDGGVIMFLNAAGLDPTRTGIQAPWQNGLAERLVGSCRRELLDHIIALNERHLYRLIRAYVAYYHQDRIHDALEKDTPDPRAVEPKPSAHATVMSTARGRSSSPLLLARRGVESRRRSRHCSVSPSLSATVDADAVLNGIRRQNAIRMVLCLRSRPPAGATLVAQVRFTPGKPRLLRQITRTPDRFAADPVLATHRPKLN